MTDTDDDGPVDDEDDYLQPGARHRNRFTTALIVALIFALGALTGAALTRILTPTPPAEIVYVLTEDGTASSPASPSPSTR